MYVTCHCQHKGNDREEATMKKIATAAKPSIYPTVTDRILSSLKAGVIPWEKPCRLHISPEARSPATSVPADLIAASMYLCFGPAPITARSGLRLGRSSGPTCSFEWSS